MAKTIPSLMGRMIEENSLESQASPDAHTDAVPELKQESLCSVFSLN